MNLLQMLNCVRGKHVRSRGHAWQDGANFRSTCRGCGAAMLRTPQGWVLDRGDGAARPDSGEPQA